jgi:hypothetical protein
MVSTMMKVKFSAISALLFFLVANPELYKMTQSVFGSIFMVAHPMGAATPAGLLLHTLVFFLATLGLMYVPNL